MKKHKTNTHGFTIIEILVVITIIGILATIITISYTGISKRATESSLTANLNNIKMQLSLFQVEYGKYPETIDCTKADNEINKCIQSSYKTIDYQVNSPNNESFYLAISDGTARFFITDKSQPIASNGKSCPTNFIKVPGSATYNTSDFCVMKYEAKNNGSDIPISSMAGNPWAEISQQAAISKSIQTVGCSGCHLITEREWMTIAQNVLSVKENWSNGNIGDGYINIGHTDAAPSHSLAANIDSEGYSDTGQSSGNQKRTLALTNGEVIWDISGNVWEWTSGQTTSNQPGVTNAGYNWREWTELTNPGLMYPDISPKTTKLFNSEKWTMNNGVGQIYSSSDENSTKAIMRGGDWGYGNAAGILAIYLGDLPSSIGQHKGFRVAAP